MSLFSSQHTYNHPWDHVTLAFWRKYPNKYSEHVKEIDVFSRRYDPKTGYLVTSRVITCESALPHWVMALGVSPLMYATEQSLVNPRTKEMIIRSRNITGASVVQVEEECCYRADPLNANRTQYRQQAKVTAFMPVFYRKLESYTVANFAKKSSQGLEVIENLCQNISMLVNTQRNNNAVNSNNQLPGN